MESSRAAVLIAENPERYKLHPMYSQDVCGDVLTDPHRQAINPYVRETPFVADKLPTYQEYRTANYSS